MTRTLRPIVKKRNGIRLGKGFSRAELEEAGLNIRQAKSLGVPLDLRRKTKYDDNVKTLVSLKA